MTEPTIPMRPIPGEGHLRTSDELRRVRLELWDDEELGPLIRAQWGDDNHWQSGRQDWTTGMREQALSSEGMDMKLYPEGKGRGRQKAHTLYEEEPEERDRRLDRHDLLDKLVLSPIDRETIDTYRLEGSAAKAAAALGIRTNSFQKRLERAVRHARERVSEGGYSDPRGVDVNGDASGVKVARSDQAGETDSSTLAGVPAV